MDRAPEGGFCGVAASFDDERPWRRAAEQAQERGQAFEAYAPFADEEVMREMRPRSPISVVRLWTLLGGIFGGVVVAFAMVIWMSRDWPLVVGGKPIVRLAAVHLHLFRDDGALCLLRLHGGVSGEGAAAAPDAGGGLPAGV